MTESDDADGGSASGRGPRSKVERVIRAYGLDGMGERLERHWLGEAEPQYSLRELAEFFNVSLLEAVLEEAGRSPLAGEAENLYRLVRDDEDVSSGERTQALRTLEREGIDVDRVERDFVSHQAVHTYLTKYREVDRSGQERTDRVESGNETIQRLKSRLQNVVRNTLSTLRDTGRIRLGEFDVLVDVDVYCRDCDTQREVRQLLESGGCDCGSDA